MKKELGIHFGAFLVFFVLVLLLKRWLSLLYYPFVVGGLIGTLLPDVDHLLHFYILKPQELTSQRIKYLLDRKQFIKSWDLLAYTRGERNNLILHSAHFQLFFLALAFFVVTSSGSLFGTGLVIAFLLHLIIDQILDYRQIGSINHWFNKIPVVLDERQRNLYIIINGFLLFLFGIAL